MTISISTNARSLLWNSSDWGDSIEQSIAKLRDQKPTPTEIEWAIELATLAELCCLDRSHAITAALWAFRADESRFEALDVAHRLAGELGDPTSRAKIAHLVTKSTKSPDAALEEGFAWLDVGNPDRAVRPLVDALQKYPNRPLVKLALSVAQCEWTNVREQIALLSEKAESADAKEKSATYMASYWLAKQLDSEPEKCGDLLMSAHRASPNEITLRAIEAWYGRHDVQRLVPIFETLADSSSPENAYRLRWRGAAKLLSNEAGTGAGFELALRTLNLAYQQGIAELPGHLALVGSVSKQAKTLRREDEVLSLIEAGLTLPWSQLEMAYLALTGLSASEDKSETYRSILAGAAPDHPLAKGATPIEGAVPIGTMDPYVPASDDPIYLDQLSPLEAQIDIEPTPIESSPTPVPTQVEAQSSDPDTMELTTDDMIVEEPVAAPPIPPSIPKITRNLKKPRIDEKSSTSTKATSVKKESPPKKIDSAMQSIDEGWDLPPLDVDKTPTPTSAKIAEMVAETKTNEAKTLPSKSEAPIKPVFSLIPKAALSALKGESKTRQDLRSKLSQLGAKRAQRHTQTFDVEIHSNGTKTNAVVRDLSKTGIFLVTDSTYKIGDSLELIIALPQKLETQRLAIEVKIIRSAHGGFGCEIKSPPQPYKDAITNMMDKANV